MKFYYKARTKEGEMRSGEIEASSKDVAALLLRKYELFPTYLEEVKRGGVLKKFAFRKKISKKDLSAFSSQLSVMLESRVPPSESLLAIASQTENEDFRNVIIEISEIVERGSSFSEAISFFPLYFDDFYINLIRAGESTGRISETLKQLAEHLKREYEIQNRIKGALIYPILVLFVAIVVLLIVLLGVIPSLAEIIGDISKASFLARLMFGLSKFVKTWGLVILLFLITIIGFFVFYFRSPKGKETLGKNLVKFPFFGEFFRKIYLARFSEGLSTLISAGLPVTQALKITSGFIGNPLYKEIILQTERAVREGENISSEIM
jgi:type IV pilus assembly protein PilC